MDIYHNTFLKFILEDDSISSTFKVYVNSCLGKGARLWLIVRSSVHSFHIAHSIFILALHFHFGLIQPSTSSFFMCEYEHGLDTFGTHLACCMF
jgi:hypothetical protein